MFPETLVLPHVPQRVFKSIHLQNHFLQCCIYSTFDIAPLSQPDYLSVLHTLLSAFLAYCHRLLAIGQGLSYRGHDP
jgi:hypothetical protein